MLSVASLLNPAPSGPSVHRFLPSPAPSASPSISIADISSANERSMISKHKMAKDAAIFAKGKVKGAVNFYPFEILDGNSLRELRKYQIFPAGKIREYCRHIPYNSGKKDFFEKTGRESFEVFQYIFKVPGDDADYTVMWDYNIGLVRMTPFFKCCKYSKTTPAKMLNLNPGLKEITHSITGGSIMAQGYWMPYQCAKAVCATFCYHISGALIPIFGPDFPSQCIPPEAPEHGRMIIDPTVIVQSTREADHFRRVHMNTLTSACSASPKRSRKAFKNAYNDNKHNSHYRIRTPFIGSDSPRDTGIEGKTSRTGNPSLSDRYNHASVPAVTHRRVGNGWTPANTTVHHQDALGSSPWLSAVPRFSRGHLYHAGHDHQTQPHAQFYGHTQLQTADPHHNHHHHHHRHQQPEHAHVYTPQSHYHWRQPKRSADYIKVDYEYDGGESSRTATRPSTAATSPLEEKPHESIIGLEKNAALLLMNLSVRESYSTRDSRGRGGITSETTSPVDVAFPRVKRLRANSM